jgi:hypothetical protein
MPDRESFGHMLDKVLIGSDAPLMGSESWLRLWGPSTQERLDPNRVNFLL